MKIKYLAIVTALTLPMGMAQAQSSEAKDSAASAPAAEAPKPEAPAEAAQATPAGAADLAKGAVVKDSAGETVGTIESTSDAGVVLAVGERKIQIPKNAIGKSDAGLVIAITKAQLEAAATRSPG